MTAAITADFSLIDRDESHARPLPQEASGRVTSIDALRGLVMFTMIFVNDLDGSAAPWWMRHFDEAGRGNNGMTFVDLVFPAFLFIVRMSIPIALMSRLKKGERWWKTLGHVLLRAASLMLIGILMVNSEGGPSTDVMGWSATLWRSLLYVAAILAFCDINPRRGRAPAVKWVTVGLRVLGFATLIFLAFAYRDRHEHRIITLHPFSIRTQWYGILGLIGWAYLMAALVFLIFRTNQTAVATCVALMLGFYAADRSGLFDHLWLARHVSIGETLGSQAAITTAGVLLASILLTPQMTTLWSRIRFTLLFIAACAAAALLTYRPWGISKNEATPAWCMWACVVTAALWLVFYLIADVWGWQRLTWPLAIAGTNVLLAYLISEGLESWLREAHLSRWYGHLAAGGLNHAIARSLGVAAVILIITAALNRVGFRVRI